MCLLRILVNYPLFSSPKDVGLLAKVSSFVNGWPQSNAAYQKADVAKMSSWLHLHICQRRYKMAVLTGLDVKFMQTFASSNIVV